ncbi:AAA family ATPase [Nonomuraea sp. NEAU-A123]|uniref:ATP-binding protein n=2 Tax=Nonomuraea sp. NEAU-A123 TaxID=2839649 RepID=UPI001BE3D4FB|nr:AAA family ATPase [Nonomuraea sp. NEAU-A123]MBT2230633.1 AAA family ATPase [Nonomuraea sp. NEAU-A123]
MIDGTGGRESRVLIRLVGSFAVERDGLRGTVGGRARTLLKLLAVERGHAVPTDRVVEALWGDRPPKRPVENVATLVSRLRRTLGPEAVTGGRRCYRLGDPPAVSVDLDEATALVAEAEGRLAVDEAAVAVAAATRAIELLDGGAVLDGESDAPWAAAARGEAAGLLRQARHAAATAALRIAEPGRARRAAEAAVAADPFDEAAQRLLMRAHATAGEPARALLAYERLRDILAAELGTDPAAETRAVHLAILREQPVAPLNGAAREGGSTLPGRAAEVAGISRSWAASVAGRSAVLLIVGEAGIGKSRLADEAVRVARATGGIVLWAQCHEIERSLFLQPFADALAPQVARLAGPVLRDMVGDGAEALARLIPEAAPALRQGRDGPGGEAGRRSAYEAVVAFLRALAARKPVLLVLEDLHLAGTATVELVHYLARRVSGARLLVVATARPTEGTAEGTEEGTAAMDALGRAAVRLELGPLPAQAVARLAAEAGQGGWADEVFQRTRGHPLFVVEMLRGLAAGERGVPEALRAAVLARVRRMGPLVERLLRAASVLHCAFDPALLGELLGLPPQVAAEQCERALRVGLLVVVGSRYEFANELTREALYSATPAPTRLVYRRRATELLGGRARPAFNGRSRRPEPDRR